MTPGDREAFIRRHRHFAQAFRHFDSGFPGEEESGKKD
jgi:hypothetical protein